MQNTQAKKVSLFEKRIVEIDFFRGFLILLVVMDHLFYNFYHLDPSLSFFHWYVKSTARSIIQPMALMSFCFVSGVSCAFSKNNWKRAIECLVLWFIIALGSNIIQILANNGIFSLGTDPSFRIDFNIIGVLGFSMLIYCFIQKKSWRMLIAFILISFLISTYFIPALRVNLVKWCGYEYYPNLTNTNFWDPLGLSTEQIIKNYPINNRPGCNYYEGTPNFYMPLFWEPSGQADYVPLFPYIIFFLCGTLFSYFIYKDKKKSIFKHKYSWQKPICFLGRHTLLIYLGQLVVLMGLFEIIKIFY
jgi:uncharacterized membrane protein